MKRVSLLIFLCAFSLSANANYQLLPWVQGATSYQSECFALYDASTPETYKTGLLYTDVAIVMQMSDDATGTALTEEDNTDIGTYTAPTNATSIRFSQCDDTAGENGTYQIELHNDTVGVNAANARAITFRLTATDMIETALVLNLELEDSAALVDAFYDESCTGHVTAGTGGVNICTDIDAILVDTGTTLDAALAVVDTNVDDIETAIAITEPTGAFAWSGDIGDLVAYVAAWYRNEVQQTSTTKTLRNDADTGNIVTCGTSDNGTTYQVDECVP